MPQAISLFLLFLLLAALIVAAVGPIVMAEVDFTPVMQIVHRDHAVKKHGADAVAVRAACDNGGRLDFYQSRSWRTPDKFFELCLLDDGRVGVRIRQWSKNACDWIEKTSFVPDGGTYKRALEYVSARAERVAPKVVKSFDC